MHKLITEYIKTIIISNTLRIHSHHVYYKNYTPIKAHNKKFKHQELH